jgi:hypothetical protein
MGLAAHFSRNTYRDEITCDVARIKKLLVNACTFVQRVGEEEGPVRVVVEDAKLGYVLNEAENDIKEVRAVRFIITTAETLPPTPKRYMAQMDWKPSVAKDVEELPLLNNEQTLKAHYGYTEVKAEEEAFTLCYVIPRDLRKVRTERTESAGIQAAEDQPRADDAYPGAQEREETFLKAIAERGDVDIALIKKAIEVIKQYHGPARRSTGEPYYLHPLAVAQMVLDYGQDQNTILGALLHDTIAETPLTPEQITTLFGQEISDIVCQATDLNVRKGSAYGVALSPMEYLEVLTAKEDHRVLYIKVMDKLHELRTIQGVPDKRQLAIAEDVLIFYVPVAEHLGLDKEAEEFALTSRRMMNKQW